MKFIVADRASVERGLLVLKCLNHDSAKVLRWKYIWVLGVEWRQM